MLIAGAIVAMAAVSAAVYIAIANWPRWAGLDPAVWRPCRYLGSTDEDGRGADRGWLARGCGAMAVLDDGIRFRRAFRSAYLLIPADRVASVRLDGAALKIVWQKDDHELSSAFSVSRSPEVTEEFGHRVEKALQGKKG